MGVVVGSTISHYKILSELGRGGMGVVYKATDTKLERPVALKFLAAHAIEDPEHKARFVREAEAAARLDHQNICPIYEIDEADGQTFLAMAYLEGQTVKDKIKARPLKLDEALDIAIQTATDSEGLEGAGAPQYDVAADGQRFVLFEPVAEEEPTLLVTQNWYEEFRGRQQD